MTPRERIINALKPDSMILDELCAKVPELKRKQIIDACTHASKDEPALLKKSKDDVTGQPLYTLTAAGKAWAPCRGGSGPRKTDADVQKVHASAQTIALQPQPEVGKNTGSLESGVSDKSLPEAQAGDYPPVAAVSAVAAGDAESKTDLVELAGEIASIWQSRAEKAEGVAASLVGVLAAIHVVIGDKEAVVDLQELPGHIAGMLAERDARIVELIEKNKEPDWDTPFTKANELAQAIAYYFDHEIGEHRSNNNPWDNALEIIKGYSTKGGVKSESPQYAIAFPGETYPTPEAALSAGMNEFDAESMTRATVVTVRPVGRVEMRPVMVPLDKAA